MIQRTLVMALEGFDIHPQEEEAPLPAPLKETKKRTNQSASEECVLPNEWTSSTLLSSPSQDHSTGSVPTCNTHVGQSRADSRSRPRSSDSSENGILQDYVVVSSDDLPTLEGENDRLYMADEQMTEQTCRFKKFITTRFSLPRSPKLKLHKGPKRISTTWRLRPTKDSRSTAGRELPNWEQNGSLWVWSSSTPSCWERERRVRADKLLLQRGDRGTVMLNIHNVIWSRLQDLD
jgi:hypothetical protein